MLSEVLLAAAFQIGPFYEQKQDAAALRPLWATEGQTTDVVWPLFTSHRDWWRFAFFTHYQSNDKGYQFELMPLFWCGSQSDENYWGLFPLYGNHPHFLLMYDIDFALWPLWMRYEMPSARTRDKGRETRASDEMGRMKTNAVLWPFVHWRDDGSWGFWPFYVCNHQRESFHQTALWPIFTWASYEADRDTAGAGSSWMFWPLCGGVSREREDQWLFLPPFFSVAETRSKRWLETNSAPEMRIRCPWPLFEFESNARRDRLSVFPFYEYTRIKSYSNLQPPTSNLQPSISPSPSTCYRFGWKLVELYPDETRIFPFWVSRKDDSYFRLWPFWESARGEDGVTRGRFLSLFPIRNVPAVDRNWAKFWTFYEQASNPVYTDHSLFWGIIRWRTIDD